MSPKRVWCLLMTTLVSRALGKTTAERKCPSYHFVSGTWCQYDFIHDAGIHRLVKVGFARFLHARIIVLTWPYSILWKQITKSNALSVELEVNRTGPPPWRGIIYIYYLGISVRRNFLTFIYLFNYLCVLVWQIYIYFISWVIIQHNVIYFVAGIISVLDMEKSFWLTPASPWHNSILLFSEHFLTFS